MDAELVALASSAASALVGAMAKDGWQAVRSRVARLFGRGDARAEELAGETLDEDAAALSPGTERDLTAQWTARLRDLLRSHPEAADEVRALLSGVQASGSGVAAGRDVNIQAAYGGVAANVIHGSVSTGGSSQGTGEA
jgi:hypothetical protein